MEFKQKIKNFMKSYFPNFFVNSKTTTITKTRLFSGNFRVLPDFIIIGVQKSGTTSLYNYLIQHPNIYPAITKQPHYFDANFDKELTWYKSHFPTNFSKFFQKKFRTGEASTDYINHPLVAKRMKKILPDVKNYYYFKKSYR